VLRQRVRDGSRADRVGVIGRDDHQRAVGWNLRTDVPNQLLRRGGEVELVDDGLERRPFRGQRRIRGRQLLRDDDLVDVRIQRLERLAYDQRGLRFVYTRLGVAEDEGSSGRKDDSPHEQGQPFASHAELMAEIHDPHSPARGARAAE
jgi:hypothetical protein